MSKNHNKPQIHTLHVKACAVRGTAFNCVHTEEMSVSHFVIVIQFNTKWLPRLNGKELKYILPPDYVEQDILCSKERHIRML
jgi:hypothetical protein